MFYEACLKRSLESRKECPVTRKPLSLDQISPAFAVRELVGSAKISCPFALEVQKDNEAEAEYQVRSREW